MDAHRQSRQEPSDDDNDGFNDANLMEYRRYCLAFSALYARVDNVWPLTLQEYFDERAEIAFYSHDAPVDDAQRDDTHPPADGRAPIDAHDAAVATDTGSVTVALRARPRWKRGSLQATNADK